MQLAKHQITSELQSNQYTLFTEVYLTELQPKDVPTSNVAKSCCSRYSRTTTQSVQLAKHQTTSELQSNKYIFFTEVYSTELQPNDVPTSNVAKS